jgi:hypothetical protein
VIVGVLALLAGMAAWLLPDPTRTVCGLSGHRFPGCNDVPDAYLGTWRGHVTMTLGGESGTDAVTIHRASVGEGKAADQRAVDWRRDGQGRDRGCSREWRLKSVRDDRMTFEVTETHPNDPTAGTAEEGCLPDVTVEVRLVEDGTITITGYAGASSNSLVARPGMALYQGTLHRVDAAD